MGAFLDAGDYYGRDDTADVPATVLADVRRQLTEHRARHGRGTWPETHRLCGSNRDRQWIGRPGHCSVCALVGHLVAHPERGCSGVGCGEPHDEAGAPGCESALSVAEAAPEVGLGAGEHLLYRAMATVVALRDQSDRAIDAGLGLLERAAERLVAWVVKF